MFPGSPFDPELMKLFQALAGALISYTPEEDTSAFCVIEQAPGQGRGRLRYRIGCKDRPNEGTTKPSPELHESAYQLYRLWSGDGEPFPGAEITVEQESGGQWKTNVRRLDGTPDAPSDPEGDERLWQEVYDARSAWFVEHLGPLPGDIQKILSLSVVWPGGGMYTFTAPSLGGRGVCATFGLTNADLPTPVRNEDIQETKDKQGRPASTSFRTVSRVPRWAPPEWAGYGYEVLVITPAPETWPLQTLAWLAQMELLRDVDLLDRVRDADGVTLESVRIGDGSRTADFLIQPANGILPARAALPNGEMNVLIATRITRDEMTFSQKHGRGELLRRLLASGVGQVSNLDRPSVLA